MNTKYLNFSIFFIILSFFDIITTQYALLKYPSVHEGNMIMAMVTSSFLFFVFIKAFGVMIIMGLYHRIKKQSPVAAKIGQCIICLFMLLVVGNNIIIIASATSYGYPNPLSLSQPSLYFADAVDPYQFIWANGSSIFIGGDPSNGTLSLNSVGILLINGNSKIVYAFSDQFHEHRTWAIDSDKNIFYFDATGGVDYGLGFYDPGTWPGTCATNGNCNPIYKIGVVATLNTLPSGFVDSNGDVFVADGLKILKFQNSADYAQSDYIVTIPGVYYPVGDASIQQITDIKLDMNSNIHILIGASSTQAAQTKTIYLSHVVYNSNKVKIFNATVVTWTKYADTEQNLLDSKLLIDFIGNSTTNISIGYRHESLIYLIHSNGSFHTDICDTVCSTISDFNGLAYYNEYVYISSSAENKIYRFLTTFESYTGYTGSGALGNLNPPQITYNVDTISSDYANYYNTSSIYVTAKIDADSGYYLLGANYLVNLATYRWRIDLVDPNGVVVYPAGTSACVDSWAPLNPTGRCLLTQKYKFSAPSSGWMGGVWTLNLYETGPNAHIAYLATNTFKVFNGSINNNGSTISTPEEPITSDSNQVAITLMDGYVGLMGLGVSGVTKFLFSLILVVVFFVAGLLLGKGNAGNAAIALSTIPYTFFTYINYIPKWVFIIYIIMLIMIAKVFR